jgi:uncharacterized protein (TIGR00369 family)
MSFPGGTSGPDPEPEGDPIVDALSAGDLAALTQALRDANPLHTLMDLTVVHHDPEATVATMELTESVRGSVAGTIHGGMLATLADVVCAVAISGSAQGGEAPATTDLHIRYYRQPRSGPLRAEANVVHRGRRLLSVECSIVDGHERCLARSTATYMIVPIPGWGENGARQ